MRARRAAALMAASLLATACDGSEVAACDPIPLVSDESRFQISFEPLPPATGGASGEIRLHVEALGDWHIAPEAPAWLHMQESDEVRFDPAERLEGEAASDTRLEFSTSFRTSHETETVVHGRVKFGMCEGEGLQCILVERDLEFPLDLASQR